jgi:hypothetical protein
MDENGMFARVLREKERERAQREWKLQKEARAVARRQARVEQVRGGKPHTARHADDIDG